MKIMLTLVLAVFVLSGSIHVLANQEADKPIYKVEVRRDGGILGSFSIELFPLIAPKAVHYFDSLVTIKFYDSTAFHRVIPGFMIQGGDPNSRNLPRDKWGYGNASQAKVDAEFSPVPYMRGILGAAREPDPNSATSQFFICVAPATHLNGQYTVYGRAISGMNIVDSIVSAPRDGSDDPYSKHEMFVTRIGVNDSIPSAPVLTSPIDGASAVGVSTVLTWKAVDGVLLYHVDVSEDSTFSTLRFSGVSATTNLTVSNLELGLRDYYWRVRSNNGGHFSASSEIRSFTSSVARPQLLSPDSAATDLPQTLTLRWQSVKGAIAYHVQVATSTLFATSSIVFNQNDIVDTTVEVSGLLASKRYLWRVSAITSDYEGSFSIPWVFFSTTSAVNEETGNEHLSKEALSVHPSPSRDIVLINYTIAQPGHIVLKVIDALGSVAATLLDGQYVTTSQEVMFDTSVLSEGLYFINMYDGRTHKNTALIVVR